jgi:1,4-alpha-glucan branching enzyme
VLYELHVGTFTRQRTWQAALERLPDLARLGVLLDVVYNHLGPVREYFVANAAYWIDEFHLDGLRLDAVHSMQGWRIPGHSATVLAPGGAR